MRQALELALEALEEPKEHFAKHRRLEVITAIKEALAQPEFTKHEVENADDWSEWVCPDAKGYLIKCCDCGLVHEAEFGVVRYKSETEREDCEPVEDTNLQAVFRMRRSEQWSPEDTAHRVGGLSMAQPEQEPVAEGWCNGCNPDNCQGCGPAAKPKHEPIFWYRPVGEDGGYEGPIHNGAIDKVRKLSGVWKPLYTTPPQRTWVGLTDDEIFEIHKQVDSMQYLTFGHAIEQRLKEKNF